MDGIDLRYPNTNRGDPQLSFKVRGSAICDVKVFGNLPVPVESDQLGSFMAKLGSSIGFADKTGRFNVPRPVGYVYNSFQPCAMIKVPWRRWLQCATNMAQCVRPVTFRL